MMPQPGRTAARGGPLVMMILLLAAWVGGRAVWWENPLAGNAFGVPLPAIVPPFAGGPGAGQGGASPDLDAMRVALPEQAADAAVIVASSQRGGGGGGMLALLGSGLSGAIDPRLAAAHQLLWRAAMRDPLPYRPGTGVSAALAPPDRLAAETPPPFLPMPAQAPALAPAPVRADRWTVDSGAFWRQGSDAAPISQGRVPIYGASQIGAVLNYRLAPSPRSNSGHDPRLYARAYRALVRRGESELALGASARPVPAVPVRIAGEVRVTEGAFRSELRPSAFAVTEVPPIALPLRTRLETYAQAGWVGGTDATLFADGQASLTREVTAVANASDNALRLSLGAGAWGGAQDGAERVDLGPTVRLDVKLGAIPARFAVDWRERVGGDAGPGSGAAVTLSTQF